MLLITDGQVWDAEAIVDEARRSGHRVFTVGVGMATVEGLFAALAKATGGAMELVSPQEGMTECILTQFHRLRQPKLANSLLKFSNKTTWTTPLPKTIFAGDTIHVYAGFSGTPCASVMLAAHLADGKSLKAEARIEQSNWADLPRLAAAARIEISSSDKEQMRLALEHQLLTPQTNYLVVAKRTDKGDDLPELAKVPHMLAAGWGGTGTAVVNSISHSMRLGNSVSKMRVVEKISCCSSDSLSFISTTTHIGAVADSDMLSCMRSGRGSLTPSRLASSEMSSNDFEKYDIPAFLRRDSDGPVSIAAEIAPQTESYASVRPPRDDAMVPKLELRKDLVPQEFVLEMQKRLSRVLRFRGLPSRVNELFAYGLPESIAEQLRRMVGQQGSEREVVFAFLMNLLEHDELSALFVSGMSRLIQGAWARTPQNAQLLESIKTSLLGLNSSEWKWSAQVDYTVANVA